MSNHSQRAMELFKQGYNCSQSVVAAFCEELDIDFETALKLSSSFGGGMAVQWQGSSCPVVRRLSGNLLRGGAAGKAQSAVPFWQRRFPAGAVQWSRGEKRHSNAFSVRHQAEWHRGSTQTERL